MGSKYNDKKNQKEIALMYYIKGETQADIADKVGISRVTICKWVKDGDWETKRAAIHVTRPELVNKILLKINQLLEQKLDATDWGSFTDQLCKAAAAIERLDKKNSLVDIIDVFIAFNKWMVFIRETDINITKELMDTIIKYQDLFIAEKKTEGSE